MASSFQANGWRLSNDDTIIQGDSGLEEAREASSLSDKPQLAGYELQHQLGQGSFGQVWAGVQKSTGQAVAVKFFFAADLSYIRRELERLREVSDHFAVVGLVDADLDHQPPYFVMPLLMRSLAQEDPPGAPQAARWFGQLAAGLRHSHDKGLLHCDLKPSNVMLDESGTARLVDFGQSRQQGDGVVAWGTLGFMAPEQAALGTEQDHSSPERAWDVYGLGATMYRMLTGFCPRWSEEDLAHLMRLPLAQRLRRYREHLQIAPLIPLRNVKPGLDRDLADLIEACLRLNPDERPESMNAILEDLGRRERGLPLLCRRPWAWSYLAYKWSRRPALVAATLATVALVGSAAYSYQRISRANLELRRHVQQLTVQQAMQAQRAQDFEEAQLWWCQALKNQPDDPVLRMRLGRENFGLSEYRLARETSLTGEDLEVAWTPTCRQAHGDLLAAFGDKEGVIYDSRRKLKLAEGLKLRAPAREVAWSDQQVRVLEPPYWSRWSASGQLLERGKLSAEEFDLSPSGSWLRAGERLVSLNGAPDWKPDGEFLCFVGDGRVAVRRGASVAVVAADGSEVSLQGPVEAYEAMATDQVLLTADNHRFQLWDASTGIFLTSKRLSHSNANPRELHFSEDGRLLFGSDNTVDKVWRVDPPDPQWVTSAPGTVQKLAWGPGQQWLWAGAENGVARLAADGKVLEQRPWSQRAFSYDMNSNGLGVAELAGSLQVFWPGGRQELARYQPGQFEVFCQRVFFAQDGKLLLASMPGFLKLWRVDGQRLNPVREVAIAEPPQILALSADGQYVAALCGKLGAKKLQLGVWRLPDLDGLPLAVSEIAFAGQPLQLAFGPDNRWLVAGTSGHLVTLSLRESRQLAHWNMSLFEDGPFLLGKSWMLACPQDPSLQKVNLPEGQLAGPAWPLSSPVTALAARGELGAVSSGDSSALLDLRDGNELSPRLTTPGLSQLLWGEKGLLAARDATVGYWPLPPAAGTPAEVMARWEKLTGRTINLERSAVEDITPPR